MSLKSDPSASRLAVIRRPKEQRSESTEDKNGKEKGLIDSVELDGLTEEGKGLEEALPQVRRRQQGASSLASFWVAG